MKESAKLRPLGLCVAVAIASCSGRIAASDAPDGGAPDVVQDAAAPSDAAARTFIPVSVAVGYATACALLDDGAVYCWGGNVNGELGLGGFPGADLEPHPVPMRTKVTTRATRLTSHASCVFDAQGAVLCWGDNDYGRLGIGTELGPVATPQRPLVSPPVRDIALGAGFFGCALSGSATLCWGKDIHGALGDGVADANRIELQPTPVPSLTDAVALSAAYNTVCALLADGGVACWGDDSGGQVGDGQARYAVASPFRVPGITGAVQVSVGGLHTCARHGDGAVSCWGRNDAGQLGRGPIDNSIITAARVPGIANAIELGAGGAHACVLDRDARVMCWGSNELGAVGAPVEQLVVPVPRVVNGLPPIAQLAVGAAQNCALTISGNEIWCWGSNEAGALGDGTASQTPVPTPLRVKWPNTR